MTLLDRKRLDRPTVRHRRARSALLVGVLLLAASPVSGVHAGPREAELEPVPPALLQRDPDPLTASEIESLITNSFADRLKAPKARAQLVHRYHLWSVPALIEAMVGSSRSESQIWNSALTLGALRDVHGPAPTLRRSLDALVRLLRDESEPYRRAFAALALGCWHHADDQTPDAPRIDALSLPRERQMREALAQARREIGRMAEGDKNAHVRVAALLSLAKTGGPVARGLVDKALAVGAASHNEPRWALPIAHAFLAPPSPAPFAKALATDDRPQKRAAALGLAVAMLAEGAAPWTTQPALVLEPLARAGRTGGLSGRDGPEIVFARGVYAWRTQTQPEWRALWNIAIQPTAEDEVAVAAAQALLFCGEQWFHRNVLDWALGRGENRKLKPVVLAAFLLLLAQSGRAEGLEHAIEWLRNGARDPEADRLWDVRFYVIVGLLRALSQGRYQDAAQRKALLGALRASRKTLHKDACLHAPLDRILRVHGERIADDAFFRLPEEDVLALEACFRCPHALLSRELKDVCLHRVNQFVGLLFAFDSLRPARPDEKEGTERRFLRSYFAAHPYFRRLELLEARGSRRGLAPDVAARGGIDR